MVLIKGLLSLIILLALTGCGKGLNMKSSSNGGPAYKKIGVTAANTDGGSWGISEAQMLEEFDSLCTSEFGNGYKAMVSSPLRNINNNWVLAANKEYRRMDGSTIIGTTTAQGTFTFPLTNSISSDFGYAWTGLEANWTTHSLNCDNWADSSIGQYGQTDQVTSWSISITNYMCSAGYKLYCVQQ